MDNNLLLEKGQGTSFSSLKMVIWEGQKNGKPLIQYNHSWILSAHQSWSCCTSDILHIISVLLCVSKYSVMFQWNLIIHKNIHAVDVSKNWIKKGHLELTCGLVHTKVKLIQMQSKLLCLKPFSMAGTIQEKGKTCNCQSSRSGESENDNSENTVG